MGPLPRLAGSAGDFGYADGSGNAARFSYPGGIAADAAGNLYVADTNTTIIRKVTPSGAVSTVNCRRQQLRNRGSHQRVQYHIAADATGILYVSDQGHIYQGFAPGKEITVMAGQSPFSRLYTGRRWHRSDGGTFGMW